MLRLPHGRAVLEVHLPTAGHSADILEILASQHGHHAGGVLSGSGVHAADAGVSEVTAHDVRVGHARQDDVVRVLA